MFWYKYILLNILIWKDQYTIAITIDDNYS